MRFLFLSLFVLSAQAFAQTCNESMLLTASYPLNCDSLSVVGNIDLSAQTSPIIINVQNDVVIKAQIKLSGGNGGLLSSNGTGASGGPGASAGGGVEFFDAADAPGSSGGKVGGFDGLNTSCGDGGSGGGLVNVGRPGTSCPSSTLTNIGGDTLDLSQIETTLRGGFGGGAGGGPNLPFAAGGGGGGAIYIISQGKITVTKTGSIIANGGNGANSTNVNGAGGGGSGGVIILEGSELDIQGTLSALGGKGGSAPNKGHGGAGSAGLIRLKSSEASKDIIGLKAPAKGADLNSSISCASVKENEKENTQFLFQILIPLFLMIALGNIRKKNPAQFLK